MTQEPAVIFLHIPKTAGSTLRKLLANQYPPDAVWIPDLAVAGGPPERAFHRFLRDGGEPPNRGLAISGNRRWAQALEELPPEQIGRIQLVMGHFWFGLHELLPFPSTTITMLRDPVARVLSFYAHRRTHHGYPRSIEDYVREDRDWEISDGQVRRLATEGLSGDIRYSPMGPEALESAKRNLRDHVRVVGLTERFDEFLIMCRDAFGWRRLGYSPVNVSSNRPREAQLPPDVLATIRERNAADLELYRYALALIAERSPGGLPALERRARALRRRNAARRRLHPLGSRLKRLVSPRPRGAG